MTTPRPAFALALHSPRPGRFQYLRRGAFLGNLLRTDDPACAWTWPAVVEVRLWLDALPEAARAQLADRPLLVVPLAIAVGEPALTLTLRTTDPGRPADGEPARRVLETTSTLFA